MSLKNIDINGNIAPYKELDRTVEVFSGEERIVRVGVRDSTWVGLPNQSGYQANIPETSEHLEGLDEAVRFYFGLDSGSQLTLRSSKFRAVTIA